MRKRVLLPNGKFADFKGKREVTKLVPESTKIAQRKEADKISEKHGFDTSNPEEGGLSEEDIKLLKSGEMKLQAVISLANNRKIEIPEEVEAKEDIIAFLLEKFDGEKKDDTNELSADDAHAIKKMSIPEMRAYAKENEIKIPSSNKKADDIRNFLLDVEQPAEDDL